MEIRWLRPAVRASSPVCPGSWRTRQCSRWPVRQTADCRAAPYTVWRSPTGWHQTPTRRWLWWTYPGGQKIHPVQIFICGTLLRTVLLCSSPAGCSPRPSTEWGAPPGLGCGSSRCCTGSGSSRNRRSWWWGVGPEGSFWLPGRGAQSSETPGISSLMRSAPPCEGGQTDWGDEGRRESVTMVTRINIT